MKASNSADEGAVGLITYMRTDSTRVSDDAITEARDHTSGQIRAASIVPAAPNVYKIKEGCAGRARSHPSHFAPCAPRTKWRSFLPEDELKLYRLIWMRFVASQMNPAVFDQTTIDVSAERQVRQRLHLPRHRFRAQVRRLPRRLRRRQGRQKDEEDEELKHKLPARHRGRGAQASEPCEPEQHFTEPPPRYNEATLVKKLESDGVGRPSTYASILSTIQEREYVNKEGGKFTPTELGMVVTDLLLESFNDIFDVKLHRADGRGTRRNRRRQARLARPPWASSTIASRRTSSTPKST